MIIGTFIVYFFLFTIIFAYPGFRSKENSNAKFKLLLIPAVLGLGMVFLTVLKVFIIYKIIVLLALLLTFVLSYWQWGERIRKFWK